MLNNIIYKINNNKNLQINFKKTNSENNEQWTKEISNKRKSRLKNKWDKEVINMAK